MAAIVWGCVGCQSTQKIRPHELPLEYDTGISSYKPAVDPSKFARRAIDSQKIYPGDVLDVTLISGAEEQPAEAVRHRVDAEGNLNLPLIGPVRVAGFRMTEAEQLIRAASIERRIYRDPRVSVLLNTRQTDRVRVVGAVEEPGVYELPSAESDLLAAIVAAGGLKMDEVGTAIEIRHPAVPAEGTTQAAYRSESSQVPAGQSIHVDLSEAMEGQAGDLRLRDGSVVMVQPHVPQSVFVTGLVVESGEYELPKDKPLRVTQAVAKAGGRTLQLADTVHVTRHVPDREQPVLIEISLSKAKSDSTRDLVLAPGDVVNVVETPLTFVVDTAHKFFRFGFSSSLGF